jgi:hypothetical protein
MTVIAFNPYNLLNLSIMQIGHGEKLFKSVERVSVPKICNLRHVLVAHYSTRRLHYVY